MSNPDIPNKQFQLMMNVQLLNSLNSKPPLPVMNIYPQPAYPIIQPPQQFIYPPQMNTQLSYQSVISPHSTIMSYHLEEPNMIQTNDTSYGYYINGKKSYTAMSYSLLQPQLIEQSDYFLGKKTMRNTIIINNEMTGEHMRDEKKHYSAPIKILSSQNSKNMFETHLLKKQIEVNDEDKKYTCGHKGCELSYKTKKQKVFHHGKMDPECQKDSIMLLNQISLCKELIVSLSKKDKIKEKDVEKLQVKFEKTMRDISINDYAQMICGHKLTLPKKETNNNS